MVLLRGTMLHRPCFVLSDTAQILVWRSGIFAVSEFSLARENITKLRSGIGNEGQHNDQLTAWDGSGI